MCDTFLKYYAYFFIFFIMSIVKPFSFDVRGFIYRCKLLLMLLHDGASEEWKIDGNYVYARSKRQAKQNSVKTVSFLPHKKRKWPIF